MEREAQVSSLRRGTASMMPRRMKGESDSLFAVPKSCLVEFTDLSGVRHSAEVQADSVYEAAILALRAFRSARLMEQVPGPGARFQIQVREPAVVHEVQLAAVQRWVEQGSSSPMEQVKRARLKELLQVK